MSETPSPGTLSTSPRLEADALARILGTVFGRTIPGLSVVPLQGDASTRRYFRLIPDVAPDADPASVILMQLEEPAAGPETDFTRILDFLQAQQVRVPRCYHHEVAQGLLFLEDCGDATLESVLQTAGPEERRRWYGRVVDLLAAMQHRATGHIDPGCPAYHLSFDVAKLSWELDFMTEHYIQGMLGHGPEAPWRAELRERLLELCGILAAQEPWFTHRDFHCRNLMVHRDELVVIDFQDARMGPSQYDLVSLLRDSYMPLPESLVAEMIERFLGQRESLTGQKVDRAEFSRVFDLMAIQRNLKAVGTFAFQTTVRGNPRYREHIAPTLDYVRRTLERRPELAPLRHALARAIPALAA